MNYDEHIASHLARQARELAQETAAEAKRLVALELSCQTAEKLLRSLILPELELLQSSLRLHHLDCSVKIGKQKFDGIAAEFEAEVTASKPPVKLTFRAEPGIHTFVITLRRTAETAAAPQVLRYDEITTAAIQHHCAAFMATAFPA